MSKIIPLIKSCWHKVLCALCALAVICISVFSSVPAHATSSTWEDLGEDAVALKDAYLRYLNGWGNGSLCDIIGGAVDVPISWYKTLSDGVKAISPVDDWAYYLTEEDQTSGGGGHVRTGGSSSHASDRPSSEVAPVLPSETLKQAASYWADYYMPMPTTTQYIFSYQSEESTDTTKPYSIDRDFPIYMNTNGSWGKKNWSGVYVLPFVKDDDISSGTLFPTRYYHFYSSKEDDGTVIIHADWYSLESGNLISSQTFTWNIASYPYIGAYLRCSSKPSRNGYSNFLYVDFFPSYTDYMGDTNNYTNSSFVDFHIGTFTSLDYSVTGAGFYDLVNSITFTPETSSNDDYGVYLSSDPFQFFANQTSIDFEKIPDNYTITINGDTIYDYSITNPDTGDTSTINEYVTNNYTYITNNNGDDSGSGSGSSGGSVSGNVDVSGAVVVGGQIDIKADPIDINVNTQPIDINVNVSSGGNSGSYTGEAVDISGYLDNLPEQSETMNDYFSVFFSFVPPEFLALLISGISIAILMRVLGR